MAMYSVLFVEWNPPHPGISRPCNEDMMDRTGPFPPGLMLLETKAKKPQRRYPTQHARGSAARRSTEPKQQQRFPPKCRQPAPRGEARKATGTNTRQRAPSSINDVVLTLLLCDHLLAAGRGVDGNSLPPIPYSVLGTVQRDRALVVLAGLCQREKRVKAEPDIPSQPGRGPCRLGGPPPASSSITARPSRRLR